MRRLILALAMVALSFQGSGLSSWIFQATCEEQCEDDAGGCCSPACSSCTCCFHGRSLARRESSRSLSQSEASLVNFFLADETYTSPPPRGIFRVPKALG